MLYFCKTAKAVVITNTLILPYLTSPDCQRIFFSNTVKPPLLKIEQVYTFYEDTVNQILGVMLPNDRDFLYRFCGVKTRCGFRNCRQTKGLSVF